MKLHEQFYRCAKSLNKYTHHSIKLKLRLEKSRSIYFYTRNLTTANTLSCRFHSLKQYALSLGTLKTNLTISYPITAFSDFTTAYNDLSPPYQLHEKSAKLDAQCRVLLRYARCNLPTSKLSDHLRVNMSAFLNFTGRDHAIKGDHLPFVITLISLRCRYDL